jgi:hypothetical protein
VRVTGTDSRNWAPLSGSAQINRRSWVRPAAAAVWPLQPLRTIRSLARPAHHRLPAHHSSFLPLTSSTSSLTRSRSSSVMASAVSAQPVLVTGATGYIAGNIIDLLIRKGYSVRGTVRSLTDDKSVQLQKDFPSLQLFQADLLHDGSFQSAIDGCRFVLHTASPFQRSWTDAQKVT